MPPRIIVNHVTPIDVIKVNQLLLRHEMTLDVHGHGIMTGESIREIITILKTRPSHNFEHVLMSLLELRRAAYHQGALTFMSEVV